ncbi:Swt1 family HEPN domain-containing protein [Pararhizobium sp. LjRoot255]|uniref:Swt1 family HEPN domain-containing protein n=1 Tax=Pararhizobium sp. LjRoot255 TaxID=3342298 RepID=UPI003ECD58F1
MSAMQIAEELNSVSKSTGYDLGLNGAARRKRQLEDYDQFEKEVRYEASLMSEYYEIFYCLEISIRKLVSQTLIEAEGASWWSSARVPLGVVTEVASRRKKELDAGFDSRSDNEIDFTTFGELSSLITQNWDLFEPIFSSKSAVSTILNRLNVLRGPIAHCCEMSEDEKLRLELTVRDWFRTIS